MCRSHCSLGPHNLGPHSVSRSVSRTCCWLPYLCPFDAVLEKRQTSRCRAFPSHSSPRSSKLSQSDWASSSRQTVVHESAGDVVAMVGMMVAVCVDSVELRVFLCFM